MEQATEEVNTIFGGVNGRGNDIAPPSAPHTLGIPCGSGLIMTQQVTMFPVEVHAPTAGTTAQNLHRALMGGTPMIHNTGVGGNVMGGAIGTAAAPQ